MNRPSICILLPDLRPGGAERLHFVLAKEWRQQGVEVEFMLAQARGELLALVSADFPITDLRASRLRDVVAPLVESLKRAPPDILLVAMWPLTVLGLVAAKIAGFKGKVVVSDHIAFSKSPQTANWLRRALFRLSVNLTYRWANLRIGVSQGVVDDMASLSGLPLRAFRVIFNPAAMEPSEPEGGDKPACMSDSSIVQVLAVGTLKPQKDFGLLIHAFHRFQEVIDSHLTILGEGEERAQLEALVAKLELTGRVTLPGTVLDTGPFYASADLFVLSSRYEGFGNVIVEALSYGVPVVSTDCRSGPREILLDGRCGTLVPPGDAEALAHAMVAELRHKRDPGALQSRAKDFAPDRIANEYLRAMGVSK